MHVISHKKMKEFYERCPEAEKAIQQWYATVCECNWKNYADIKSFYNQTDAIGGQRYVFDVGGNKYRIVTVIQFTIHRIYIRFAGTHDEYDKIDCKTI